MRTLLRFLTALVPRKKPRPQVNHAFRQGQYGTFAHNICTALRLARLPVTRPRIMAFAATLPLAESDLFCRNRRRKYCYRCLRKMYLRTEGTKRKREGNALVWYFAHEFVNRSDFDKGDLLDALLGVLAASPWIALQSFTNACCGCTRSRRKTKPRD